MLELLWNYFGEFDDREGFRILILLCFAFGVPLAVGLWCKVVTWSVRQVRCCRQYLGNPSSEAADVFTT
jgi:hypothetical protein